MQEMNKQTSQALGLGLSLYKNPTSVTLDVASLASANPPVMVIVLFVRPWKVHSSGAGEKSLDFSTKNLKFSLVNRHKGCPLNRTGCPRKHSYIFIPVLFRDTKHVTPIKTLGDRAESYFSYF